MNMRKIGTDEVSAIGLGCMGITHASGAPMSIEDGAKVIETAHDLGYTLFDTAECYTGVYPDGTTAYNEEVVGKGIKSFRNEIFLASKCGVQHGGDHLILDSSPETIRKSVEGSLKRLGTDHIDLYYQHRIDPKVEPETVAETMAALIKEGKMFGRGTADDKGPAIAAIYAMRAVKELGYPLKKNVRLVLGSDEECGSSDLEYYYKKEVEAPCTFSPDAEFPVINLSLIHI